MFKCSAAMTFTAIAIAALSSFLVAATPSSALAAEITLQGPASFRSCSPNSYRSSRSSDHKVTAAYAPLGIITERVIRGGHRRG